MLTRTEVHALVYAAGVQPWTSVFFYDESYAKPTTDYLLNKFWPKYRDYLFSRGRHKWTKKRDCDNSARRYVVELQDLHAESNDFAEALAVGEFCYISNRGPHAIVIAITDEGVIFIEPQDGQRLALTPYDISTCFRVSF